ncbi:MAG: glycogen debranching protein [Spirosomataceae bacterium]
MMKRLSALLPLLVLLQCKTTPESPENLKSLLADVEKLKGRAEYIGSPFVAAGDRVYLVGHQDGSFPELGWHITGEMGGIWDHPIKLMDGFTADITADGQNICLSQADTFYNYPFANEHLYRLPALGLRAERLQFIPDGKEAAVVEYTLFNESGQAKKITFRFNGVSDLRPTWLGERTQMNDGNDIATYDETTRSWTVKDSLNDWYVTFGSPLTPVAHTQTPGQCNYRPAGKGTTASLSYILEIPAHASAVIPFTVAGSYRSSSQVKETYAEVQNNKVQFLKEKKERYQTLASTTRLTLPDKDVQQAFNWLKYSTDWLIREVPEVGRGLAAGLPDYPWWFGADSEYSLQGALVAGQFELVYNTIDLLVKESNKVNKDNGRILHEMSTNGAVFNPGNINETPQFASLIRTVYQWTGNKAFLQKYYPVVTKGLDWLLKENDKDGNLLPDGFGMMEIHGLNSEMIDVAAYTQKAFADAAVLALEMGDKTASKKYGQIAEQLKQKINRDFWVAESQSYADFIGTKSQTLQLITDAVVRADTLNKPWAVAELKATANQVKAMPADTKKGFVLYHNWVVNTPLETGVADADKALSALETGHKFVNPFGMFVTGIDRDESAGKDESSSAKGKKVFTYTGAVMTLPTGVQAIAENNYGRPDRALDYLKRMTRAFGYALPGSMYEVSPDYGMFAQAWTLYSFGVPLVRQFFGVQPEAAQKQIRIRPQMPTTWNEAQLENLKIGDNALTMDYHKTAEHLQITLQQNKEDWKIQWAFPAGKYRTWKLNGQPVTPKKEGNWEVLEASGEKMDLELH